MRRKFFVRYMNDRIILNIRPLTNPDEIHITPYDRIEPNAGIFSNFNIADYMDSVGNKN